MTGERLRILLLLPFSPRLDGRHGGSRSTGGLLDALAARYDVAVLFVRGLSEAPADESLAARCALMEGFSREPASFPLRWLQSMRVRLAALRGTPTWVGRWHVPALQRRLDDLLVTWRPDIVQAEFHVMAQYSPSVAEGAPPFVLTQHESGTMTVRERLAQARGVRRLTNAWSRRAWNRYERTVLPRADAVVVLSERDAAEALRLGARRVRRIPLGFAMTDAASPRSTGTVEPGAPEVLFVGNFRHPPNVDAAHWLAGEIAPRLRLQYPAAMLRLVGATPPASVRALAGPGVDVANDVPDVTPYLERATVVVAPLRLGSGMRVKVLETLAAGKPLVATPRAVEGLTVIHNEHVLIAEDTDALVSAIGDLFCDEERRLALGTAAFQWARQNLDWSRVVDEYDALYRELRRASTASAGKRRG